MGGDIWDVFVLAALVQLILVFQQTNIIWYATIQRGNIRVCFVKIVGIITINNPIHIFTRKKARTRVSTSYLTPYRSKALYTRSVHLCYNKNIIILPTQTSFFYSASSSHDYRHEKRNKRFDSARKASYMALWVGLFDADVWFSSHSALLPFARPRDNGENMLTTKLCYYLECWLIFVRKRENMWKIVNVLYPMS